LKIITWQNIALKSEISFHGLEMRPPRARTFALVNLDGSEGFGDSGFALELWALLALELAGLLVVGADGAGRADAALRVEEGAFRAGNCRREASPIRVDVMIFEIF
jgi:hypothetical protein